MSEKRWTTREMIADWLKEHGYDGLWNGEDYMGGDGCGCFIDDLFVCDYDSNVPQHCQAGYRVRIERDGKIGDGIGPEKAK